MLEAALEYARRGFRVFPLKPRSKVPATTNGLKDATTDAQRIRNWWAFNPEYNIGLRTGNGLAAVDVDTEKLTPDSEAWANRLPAGYCVSTGRGYHIYYLGDGRNTAGRLPGIDTRGEGGYVVAPPSVHPNGEEYLASGSLDLIPKLPQAVIDLMADKPPQSDPEGGATTEDGVAEGGRNQFLASAAGKMQRSGILTLEALLALNEERCDPPLPDGEVQAIYNSIARYQPTTPIVVEGVSPLVVKASSLSLSAIDGLADKAKVKGLSTGIPALDELLGGGYRLGEFTALSASAKTGKSSFVAQLIRNLITQGVPVAYGSREMDPSSEVIPNVLSMQFKENVWLTEITQEKREQYQEAIATWPLYFSPGYGYFPITQIREWVAELVKIGIHYFYLDHLHYCLDDPEDYKAAVKLAQELKTITKEFNISLFCIIQPGKLMEGQKLGFNHMRGGAGVAQALDSVLILDRHRIEGREVRGISKLTLDIARHKLARPGSIYLEYDFQTTEFHHVEPGQQGAKVEDPAPPRYEG